MESAPTSFLSLLPLFVSSKPRSVFLLSLILPPLSDRTLRPARLLYPSPFALSVPSTFAGNRPLSREPKKRQQPTSFKNKPRLCESLRRSFLADMISIVTSVGYGGTGEVPVGEHFKFHKLEVPITSSVDCKQLQIGPNFGTEENNFPKDKILGCQDSFCECEWQENVAGHGCISAPTPAGRRCYAGRTFRPTFSANFFCRRFRVTNPILSTQRIPHSRDVDFIYTNFRGRPDGKSDCMYRKNAARPR